MKYKPLDLASIGSLAFKAPDHEKYPCSELAYEAGRMGGTMTAILNAANEAANDLFRTDVGLGFLDTPKLIEKSMDQARDNCVFKTEGVELEDILEAHKWARRSVEEATRDLVEGTAKKLFL